MNGTDEVIIADTLIAFSSLHVCEFYSSTATHLVLMPLNLCVCERASVRFDLCKMSIARRLTYLSSSTGKPLSSLTCLSCSSVKFSLI